MTTVRTLKVRLGGNQGAVERREHRTVLHLAGGTAVSLGPQ